MIRFADFVPKPTAEIVGGSFFKDDSRQDFESFHAAVEAATAWIAEEGIQVLHIETVVLPNIWLPGEEGSVDGALKAWGHAATHWHQFIRVWYDLRE